MATLNCRRLFIVDACNAGRLGTDLELKDLVRRWRNENIAVWCAALAGQDAKQISFANGRTMGRFTNALIEAIKGGADSGKKDGYVTLRETEAYMETAFSSYETRYQKPKLYKWPGASSLLDLQLFKKN